MEVLAVSNLSILWADFACYNVYNDVTFVVLRQVVLMEIENNRNQRLSKFRQFSKSKNVY